MKSAYHQPPRPLPLIDRTQVNLRKYAENMKEYVESIKENMEKYEE